MATVMFTEVVSKSIWPDGLFCVCCGKRILNGRTAYWRGMEVFDEECEQWN